MERPSASLGTPLLERGMCVKTRHLCVRALRTHTYRGGTEGVSRRKSHEFPGSIGPRRRCAAIDGVGKNRAGARSAARGAQRGECSARSAV